jgi:ribose-phosphate pyrophosphokinase
MPSPEEICQQIRAALEHEPRINLHRYPIHLHCEDGIVTVDGDVEHIVAKKLALERAAAMVPLAAAVAEQLGVPLGSRLVHRFPDGELHVELQESVRGHDVYLIQSTSPPVEAHLLELWFLADACRRAGAAHLTALVPYFGYARQDRRASGREAVGARLIADLFAASGL